MAVAEEREMMSYDEAYYLDIEPTKEAEAEEQIELMNVGTKSIEESSNPTEKSVQYIGDKSKTNTVTGYDNQFALELDRIKNNKVNDYLANIFDKRLTGRFAQQNLYIVDLLDPTEGQLGTATKFKCRKINTTAVIENKTVTAGETTTLSGSLKGVGDFSYGSFDTSTKTFTVDEETMSAMQKVRMLNSQASTMSTTSTIK